MYYGQRKSRQGTISFTDGFPCEPPEVQFDEKLLHPYVDGTRYQLDLDKWTQHNLSMLGLLLDIHEQLNEAVDYIDEVDDQMIFDLPAEGFFKPMV